MEKIDLYYLKKNISKIRLKNPSFKIVATNGCFDVLHYGHVKMLKFAKRKGDYLIVGLNSDKSVKKIKGKNRPINNQRHRKKVLEELRSVDAVFIFNKTTCEDFLKTVKPDVYVKGGDYNINSLNEKEKNALKSCNSKIIFVKFKKGLSSTNILNKI